VAAKDAHDGTEGRQLASPDETQAGLFMRRMIVVSRRQRPADLERTAFMDQ
jgi:hypothetical protein